VSNPCLYLRSDYAQGGVNLTFLDHLRRTARDRSRTITRPLVLAGVAALSLTPLAIAAPAGAAAGARAPSIGFFGGVAKFHVGGHAWVMSISDFSGFGDISISALHESDTWFFPAVPKSDLRANVRTGKATFNARNSLAPVAFANLRFVPSSRHKVSCHTGSQTIFDGRITGSITLVANHRGLKFTSAHVVFRSSSLTIDRQCNGPSGPGPCFAGFWNTFGPGPTSVTGDSLGLPGQRTYSIDVIKQITLRAPKNASVTYGVFGAAKKPVFDSKRKRLSVQGIGVVKGSAVLAGSGPPIVMHSRCLIGRRHFKARSATYSGSYTSPRGFSVRSIAAGLLKVGRSGGASFQIVTFTRA
jgi:hypothetical protein